MSDLYTTVVEEDGVNYREIAEIMTEIGFEMNHSSVRNYVLRAMKKFVEAYAKEYDIVLTDDKANELSRSPTFQMAVVDILNTIKF